MEKLSVLILALLLIVSTLLMFVSCNKQVFDTTYAFDYALVQFPDGTSQKIEIKKWNDYDGEQIQIVTEDGKIYLNNSVNCVLVKE